MQIANVRLRFNKVGSDVPVFGCTPAEALLLHVFHQGNNGGSTFGEDMDKIDIQKDEAQTVTGKTEEQVVEAVPAVEAKPAVGTVGQPGYVPAVVVVPAKPKQVIPAKNITRNRTDAEELARLKAKYGRVVTKKGDSIIGKIWPGINVTLPQKFSDLKWSEINFDGNEIASLNLATGQPITT